MAAPTKGAIFVALDDYAAKAKSELSLSKGDLVKVLKLAKGDDAWWNVQNLSTKKKGYIPSDLVAEQGSMALYEWCHGAISRNGAEYLLKKHDVEGMYLVRESQSQPGQYTLDVWQDGKAIHYRITKGENGYFFRQNVCYPTIPELIEHHQGAADGLCTQLVDIAPKAHAKTVVMGMELDKKWELKRSDVVLGDMLGGGNYGEVFKGTFNKETVAVKTIKEDSMETAEFMKEAHVMKKLQHPNLVRLIGVCSQELPMYIVQEFVPNGDLLTYLRRPKSRKEVDHVSQLYIAYQIADGMSFLEQHKTIHRDLAARNCLVGENLLVKVADFGMGRVVDDLYTARTGTKMPIKWTAPEALCYDAFSTASDVWSFGILLWEITTYGDVPYPEFEARDVIHKLEEGYRMPEPDNCPPSLHDVMNDCWEMLPKDRPTFAALKLKLEELHAIMRGEKPKVKRAPSVRRGKEWRDEFKKEQAAAAPPAPAGVSMEDLKKAFELTKKAFGSAQALYRYATAETVGNMVTELMPVANELLSVCKTIPDCDMEAYKMVAAAVTALVKAKNKMDKIHPAADKLRNGARELNKSLRVLMARGAA